jgi:hypothetical protein
VRPGPHHSEPLSTAAVTAITAASDCLLLSVGAGLCDSRFNNNLRGFPMTVSTQHVALPAHLPLKASRYAVLVALALLSVAIVVLIISATHPISSDDLGVLTAFPP